MLKLNISSGRVLEQLKLPVCQTAVNAPEDYRQTLLETARTLTEMGGLEDMLLTTKIPAAGFVSVEDLRTELEDVRVALHLQEAADHIAGQPGQILSP